MLLLRTTRKAGWNTKEWCFRAPRTCQVRLNFMGRHHGGKGTYENWANILNCHFSLSDISWGKYLLIIGSGLEDNLRKTERNGTFNNLMRLEKQKLKLVTDSAARTWESLIPERREVLRNEHETQFPSKHLLNSYDVWGLKRRVEFHTVFYYWGDKSLSVENQNLRGPRIHSRL